MRWSLGRALLSVLVLVAGPRPVSAQTDPALATGIRQVQEGDFEGAVATLEPAAERLARNGGPAAAQACLQLGIALLALDQRDPAIARFREALTHQASLRLARDRYSPKVLGAFDEALRLSQAEKAAAQPTERAASRHGLRRTALVAGGALAAGAGVALAASGGGSSPGATATFASARFGTLVLECPNGSVATPLPVQILVSVRNDGEADLAIGSVTAVLIVAASPAVPSEIGMAVAAPAVVQPAVVPRGAATLRVQTVLECGNGSGDASRFNEWRGRVTLTTGNDAHNLETVDTMRVNLP